jgi:uncharacterized membrane protein YjjP (DUF1212 family)
VTAQQFVLALGQAMHALGSPSYRVEDSMTACSQALGLRGSFFATPTAIFAALEDGSGQPQTVLQRVTPGDHDLGRLAKLYSVRDAVMKRQIEPAAGLERIRDVLAPTPARPWRETFALGMSGTGAAVLFGGGWVEVAVATGASLLVGLLAALGARYRRIGDLLAPLATAIVSFACGALSALGVPVHPPIAMLASVVVLLPGLSFTTALAELAMRHLAAGSARLMGTLVTLLTMAIGVGLGSRSASLLFGPPAVATTTPLAWYWVPVAVLVSWYAFAVVLRASRKQAPWVLVGIVTGFLGARAGTSVLGQELGAFVGAVAVAFAANLFARWRRRPAAVVRTPGLLLLVPGSLGFRGFTMALDKDFGASAQFAMQALLVGGSIVAGLLIAGALLPPPLEVEPDSRGAGSAV